jgi:hypothetical protein
VSSPAAEAQATGDIRPGPAELPPAAAPAAAPPAGDKPPRGRRKQPSGHAKRKAAQKRSTGGAGTGSSTPSAGAALNAEVRKIEEAVTAILVAPAVPMHMSGDDWPADHVEARGPELSKQIGALARRNAAFRAQLQKLLSTSENGQLAFAAAAYLVPVLIYYGVIPVPVMVKNQLEVPDRGAARSGVVPDWEGGPGVYAPEDGSQAQARPRTFTEQPPGTPGSPPAPGGPPAV